MSGNCEVSKRLDGSRGTKQASSTRSRSSMNYQSTDYKNNPGNWDGGNSLLSHLMRHVDKGVLTQTRRFVSRRASTKTTKNTTKASPRTFAPRAKREA